ncbi:right-handed parallel beta-helix repeat-containing protein [Thiohalorhabdus sp. Cl-TMA]|uniref:Right-handed parallel beta-helix repeat-containing protein n=1 Tax=Thiohalorhabdus methylotrophus TaxID=3242694 RepID=A0ABV4TVA8_9GAMM
MLRKSGGNLRGPGSVALAALLVSSCGYGPDETDTWTQVGDDTQQTDSGSGDQNNDGSGSGDLNDGGSGSDSGSGDQNDGGSGSDSGSGDQDDGDSGSDSGSGDQDSGDSGSDSGSGDQDSGDSGSDSGSADSSWSQESAQTDPDEPDYRPYSGVTAGNGFVYYWGGGHKTHPGNDVDAYDIVNDRWVQLTEEENWENVWEWDHLTEQEKQEMDASRRGGWEVDLLSPRGRPVTKHSYGQMAWWPGHGYCLLKQRFWCYDPEMGDADGAWTDLGQPPFNIAGIAPWNLTYDPDLDTVVSFTGTGTGNAYKYNPDSGNWTTVASYVGRDSSSWSDVYSVYDPGAKQHIVYAGQQWQKVDLATGAAEPMAQLRHKVGVDRLGTFSLEWAPELDKVLVANNTNGVMSLYTYDPESDTWSDFSLKGTGPVNAHVKWDTLARDPKTGVYVLIAKDDENPYETPQTWTFRLSGDTAPGDGSGTSSGTDSGSGDSSTGGDSSGDIGTGGCNADTCVGSDFQYASIQQAVDNAPDGGTVGIQSGSYQQCFVIRNAKSVSIKALDGRPHLHSKRCDGKGIVTNYSTGKVVLEGLELSNVPSEKAIWHHDSAGTLILRNVEVHNAGMGILASTNSERLEIINSEFYDTDDPTENGHLVYAGQVKDLVIRGSYFHGARNGHLIKAKSVNVTIENNFLHDTHGTTANLINIWGCGNNRVIGNAIVSENTSGAVQAMDVTVRKRYGDVKPCPVNHANLTVAYNSFLKKGETLWSSLLLDVYEMDSMVVENNLATNARLVKDGTTTGVYWYPGDWNGKNATMNEGQYVDQYLHVNSAPAAVSSQNQPDRQYAHPTSTEARSDASTMGAYAIQ